MTNKTGRSVRNESFLLTRWEDEKYIEDRLMEAGFDMEYTTWVYSWTVPVWVDEDKKASIKEDLEASNYKSYLVNVKQETPLDS